MAPLVIELPPVPARPVPPTTGPVPSIGKDRTGGTAPSVELPPVGTPKPAPSLTVPEVATPPAPTPKPPQGAPLLPPVPTQSKAPAGPKTDKGGSEESYVSEGTITFGDEPPASTPRPPAAAPKPPAAVPEPPPAAPKPSAAAPQSSAVKPVWSAPAKPAEGTLTLTPPPMPPSKPASAPVVVSAPPSKVAAAPSRPTVPPAARLKERIQGICGPAYVVCVTVKGKNMLQVDVTGLHPGDEKRLMERIAPVLEAPEFSGLEINCDIVAPAK
jgi:hypothetical protein